jgi:hypothetical protein
MTMHFCDYDIANAIVESNKVFLIFFSFLKF